MAFHIMLIECVITWLCNQHQWEVEHFVSINPSHPSEGLDIPQFHREKCTVWTIVFVMQILTNGKWKKKLEKVLWQQKSSCWQFKLSLLLYPKTEKKTTFYTALAGKRLLKKTFSVTHWLQMWLVSDSRCISLHLFCPFLVWLVCMITFYYW